MSALLSGSAFAADKDTKNNFADVAASLKKNNPDIPPIKEIRATPVANIYEVVVNDSDLFYTEKDGKHLFFGTLVKVENGKKINLTEDRVNQLTAVDFKDFNLSDAITRKIGNGKDKIITFEDPNCGYCKKLQPELAKLTNVTIYTFVLPILGPKSLEDSKAIWCSADKAKEWENHFKTGSVPKLEECDTSALDRNLAFARSHKIQGTPAIFFENGKSIKGAAPIERILEVMGRK